MKRNNIAKQFILLTLAGSTFWACERMSQQERERMQQTEQTTDNTRSKAEAEVDEFKNWIVVQENKPDSARDREWPKIKEEYKQRTTALDRKLDSLGTRSKDEYNQLKERYRTWETKREQRSNTPLDPATVKRFEQDLLGPYASYENIDANTIKEAYVTFMRNLRAKDDNWNQHDWDYANHVMGKLNERKRSLPGNIATSDELKIKALQAEYNTMETAHDAKDLGQELKKD